MRCSGVIRVCSSAKTPEAKQIIVSPIVVSLPRISQILRSKTPREVVKRILLRGFRCNHSVAAHFDAYFETRLDAHLDQREGLSRCRCRRSIQMTVRLRGGSGT